MLILPVVLLAVLAQVPRPPQVIVGEIKDRLAELEQVLGPQTVAPSQLQAALDRGGEIHLQKSAIYPLSITVRSNTTLNCHGAGFIGEKKIPAVPAIDIPPGTQHVVLKDCPATGPSDLVIRIGRNTAAEQGSLMQVPTDIVFLNVGVPTHRGKRAMEVNGELACFGCYVADVYDPSGQDSQGIAVLNSAGNILLDGCDLRGASETVLIGGDTNKLGVVPRTIVIRNTKFSRVLAEQHDGIARKTKTPLEFKAGEDILVQRCTFNGSWKDAQDGWAITITPRNGSEIHRAIFEDLVAINVAGGFNIMGFDNATVTPRATSGIVIRRVQVVASVASFGGRGAFALITAGVADVTVEDCTFATDGTKFIEYGFGAALLADGTKRTTDKLGALSVTASRFVATTYGFSLAGQQNAANAALSVGQLTVSGNIIADAKPALKTALPNNTYVDRASFDALFVDAAAGDYRLKAGVR